MDSDSTEECSPAQEQTNANTSQDRSSERRKQQASNNAQQASNNAPQNSGDNIDSFILFRQYMDNKLQSFKRELVLETEQVSLSLAKKLRREPEPDFKFKGNAVQHKFNVNILECVQLAQSWAFLLNCLPSRNAFIRGIN